MVIKDVFNVDKPTKLTLQYKRKVHNNTEE